MGYRPSELQLTAPHDLGWMELPLVFVIIPACGGGCSLNFVDQPHVLPGGCRNTCTPRSKERVQIGGALLAGWGARWSAMISGVQELECVLGTGSLLKAVTRISRQMQQAFVGRCWVSLHVAIRARFP